MQQLSSSFWVVQHNIISWFYYKINGIHLLLVVLVPILITIVSKHARMFSQYPVKQPYFRENYYFWKTIWAAGAEVVQPAGCYGRLASPLGDSQRLTCSAYSKLNVLHPHHSNREVTYFIYGCSSSAVILIRLSVWICRGYIDTQSPSSEGILFRSSLWSLEDMFSLVNRSRGCCSKAEEPLWSSYLYSGKVQFSRTSQILFILR